MGRNGRGQCQISWMEKKRERAGSTGSSGEKTPGKNTAGQRAAEKKGGRRKKDPPHCQCNHAFLLCRVLTVIIILCFCNVACILVRYVQYVTIRTIVRYVWYLVLVKGVCVCVRRHIKHLPFFGVQGELLVEGGGKITTNLACVRGSTPTMEDTGWEMDLSHPEKEEKKKKRLAPLTVCNNTAQRIGQKQELPLRRGTSKDIRAVLGPSWPREKRENSEVQWGNDFEPSLSSGVELLRRVSWRNTCVKPRKAIREYLFSMEYSHVPYSTRGIAPNDQQTIESGKKALLALDLSRKIRTSF